MNNLTMANVDADISMLMDGFSSDKRFIPSVSKLLKISTFTPFLAGVLSFISVIAVYFSVYQERASLKGFWDFFTSEGWVVVAPTVIVGLLFSFMTYTNLMVYMTVPDSLRNKSIILNHLKKVAQRTVTVFLMLMALSALLSGVYSWMAFAIPGLLFILFFAVNLVVGAEINRLGAGLALKKISELINKI